MSLEIFFQNILLFGLVLTRIYGLAGVDGVTVFIQRAIEVGEQHVGALEQVLAEDNGGVVPGVDPKGRFMATASQRYDVEGEPIPSCAISGDEEKRIMGLEKIKYTYSGQTTTVYAEGPPNERVFWGKQRPGGGWRSFPRVKEAAQWSLRL